MEKQPGFLRKYSKEAHQEERDALAADIREKRKSYYETEKTANEQRETRESIISERVKEIEALADKIEEITTSGPAKILRYFELRKLRAELATGQNFLKEYEIENPEIDPPDRAELEEARNMVDIFYRKMGEEWAEAEYDMETVKELFTEEKLVKLSLDDYALLLKRFPKYMLTHVTRQGIRDHTGHMYHQAGVGSMAHGFEGILESGRLRSSLSLLIAGENAYCTLEERFCSAYDNEEDALRNLNDFVDPHRQGGAPSYGRVLFGFICSSFRF